MPLLDPVFGYLIIAGIALLFASAAVHKWRDLRRFTEVLTAYEVLPKPLARRAAWIVPCLELSVAAGLAWAPGRQPLAVVPAMALLIAYAAALGINLGRGLRDLDCGCTARGRRSIAAWMVWRNLSLAALLGIAALPWSSRPFNAADLLTVAGGLAVGAALYAAVDRLFGDVVPRTLTSRRTA